ncbi:hypothetical protein DL96DRAFT_144010 [Flagelloscypha sp. PMI_526]|nr:hypothetical protein DL96DRAFT_144010 [Flagelloscypha sp. PMI_526]
MMAEAESRLLYARYFDDSDVWLGIFSLLEVDDLLQLRQVSQLFYELTHRTAVWLALYHRQEPTLPLFFPPTSSSIGRFLKFRTNWTSPHPFPVEAPRELSVSRRQNKVADLRIVELRDGSSWLVVINLPRIFHGKPWRNGRGELHHSNFVFVQAIPFDTIDAPLHSEKKSSDLKWEFGKWTVVDGLPGHTACWVFDEDEDSPYILSLICIDGFIYTYSLSPTEGWICMIKTPLTMVPHDRIGFVASSGCRAIVVINVWNLPTKELVNSPGTTIALMDLRNEEGKIALLHNPVEWKKT